MGRFLLQSAEDGRQKIAQIVGNARIGGVVECVLNYYRFADRSRYRFDFITYGHSDFDERLHAIDPQARVHVIPRLDRTPLRAVSALRGILRDGGYPVAHAHMTTLSAFALFAAKRAGVPVRICHAHSTFDRDSDHYWIKAALRPFAARNATHRMACGELAAQNLYRRHAEEAILLPNAIDLQRFAPDPQAKARLGLNGPVLLFVGRFVYQKNLFFLLEAFAGARKQAPLTLVLMGGGADEPALRARAEALNIGHSVRFVPPGDPAPYYAAADTFVLPSRYEGFPVVGLEAQAAGLHCLFSDKITREADVCGHSDFLPLDPAVWAERMARHYPHAPDNAQKLRQAHFDIRAEAPRLLRFYDEALAGLAQ